jgi:serine protease Do
MRDSKPTSVSVKLEALGGGRGTETASGERGKGRWGLSLGDLTPDVRNELQGQEQAQSPGPVHGAVVEDVQPGSPADNAGLQRGDVIMEVNRHSVKSASEVAHALSGVPSGQDALVLVWSNGGSTFRVLHPSQG